MRIGSALAIALVAIVGVEAIDSYEHSMFWPSQVVGRWGKPGLPFVAHGGMWSDLIVLPILFRYLVNKFVKNWSGKQVAVMLALGMSIAVGNHLLLMFTQDIPDPIGWKMEWLSLTIVLHMFYMGTLVAIVGLFYFCSRPDVTTIVWVTIALGVHMMAGMHVPLGILQRYMQWAWCPDFLASPVLPYLASGVWAVLALLATYAICENITYRRDAHG